MYIKVESLSTYPLDMSVTPITIDKLPAELILRIIQFLGFKDWLSIKLTCHRWQIIIDKPNTVYSRYAREIDAVKRLPLLAPKCSAWEEMPRHWGLYSQENVLKLSSCSSDIIALHPPFCQQSSKFFSFSSSIPFSDRYILLAKYNNTYFLTEQGQTQIKLELPNDLQPLASYKLITKNFHDPSKDQEISLLRDLAASEANLSYCQIDYCFPISESNVAIVTRGGEVSFWDLSEETPLCYRTLQIKAGSEVHKIGSYLVLKNKMIDLANQTIKEQEFTFRHRVVTCNSALCTHNIRRKKISYFSINSFGFLNKKFDIKIDDFMKYLDSSNGQILSLFVQEMTKQYTLLICWQNKALNLLVLNSSDGNVTLPIRLDVGGQELYLSDLYRYPHFSHVSRDMLIYKHPQEHTVYFWHIPTKKLIQKFEWAKFIYDVPLYLESAFVQDMRFQDGNLTILLSSLHTRDSNKPGKFRVIQFDSQSVSQQGWISSIYSTISSIYYAFPGQLSY